MQFCQRMISLLFSVPSIVGAIVCAVFLLFLLIKRKERDVVYSDWRFTCAFIVGCIVRNLALLCLIGANTDELCLLRMWLLPLCIVSTLSPLLVKIWRIYRLVGRNNMTMSPHTKAAMLACGLIFIEVVTLSIFS